MLDIPFHINLFISLIDLEDPLKTSNKRTYTCFTYLFLVEVEHPYKASSIRRHLQI